MSDKPESVRMHRNPPGVISFKSFWQECDPSCFGTDSRVHWEHADFVPLAALEDAQGARRTPASRRGCGGEERVAMGDIVWLGLVAVACVVLAFWVNNEKPASGGGVE